MDNVIYSPGNEPENIRKRIDRLFAKLDEAYPNKEISGLNKDHKKWGETVTQLYRLLGYSSGKAFLEAYGYTVVEKKAGRKAGDHFEIIAELKRRYPDGPSCSTLLELKDQNPDLAPKFKNLTNQSSALFGMTFAKYLEQEGILKSKPTPDSTAKEEKKKESVQKPENRVKKEAVKKSSVKETKKQAPVKPKEHVSENTPSTDTVEEYLTIDHGVYHYKVLQLSMNNPDLRITKAGVLMKSKTHKYNIALPKGITAIGKCAFDTFSHQDIVVLPEGVTEIRERAFSFSNVRLVKLPESLISIGHSAFSFISVMKEITIPKRVKTISDRAFSRSAFRDMYILSTDAEFGENCFYMLEKCMFHIMRNSTAEQYIRSNYPHYRIQYIDAEEDSVNESNQIEASSEGVERNDFYSDGKQRVIYFPEGMKKIFDDSYHDSLSLRKVVIPDSVTVMGSQLFIGCKNLKEVKLSENLVEINSSTFENTGIQRIIIPESVKEIGSRAFGNCESLSVVVIQSDVIIIHQSSFEGSPNVIIYCQDHLIPDIHSVTGLPCKPLDSVPAEEDTSIVFYYDNLELMKAFPDSYPVEKAKNYKVIIGAKEFKVRIKSESHIEEYEESYPFYSFAEAEKNFITLEESRQEIIDADPDMGSDAYIYDARPRVDEKNAKGMKEDESLLRFDFLKKVYRSLNKQETIQLIAEEAPKKKDGTFKLKSYLRIACAGLVDFDCCAIEIVAKAKSDTSLEVLVKDIRFSPEEVKKIRDDFFTRHILKEEKLDN